MWGVVAVLSLAVVGRSPLEAAEPDDVSKQAYELRMKGDATAAKALLEQALAENNEDAAAHFELARVHAHLATGNPRKLKEHVEGALQSIRKAVKLKPVDAAYLLFQGHVEFFHAYLSMHEGETGVQERVEQLCGTFERAVAAGPDSPTPRLYLVEIYGTLSGEMGGDRAKAEIHARKLENLDAVLHAKARSILLPEGADRVEFWKGILKEHEGDADVLEELGKACLLGGKYHEGAGYLEQAIKSGTKKEILLLDLARFHLLKVMHGEGPKEAALAAAEKAARRYLDTKPSPPMRAYALEILAKIKFGMDDKESVARLREEAAKIDPHHSKAFGIPNQMLFSAPGQVPTGHRYLLRPF
jgi:tetratricopeptide (TPR) repeat protein